MEWLTTNFLIQMSLHQKHSDVSVVAKINLCLPSVLRINYKNLIYKLKFRATFCIVFLEMVLQHQFTVVEVNSNCTMSNFSQFNQYYKPKMKLRTMKLFKINIEEIFLIILLSAHSVF
jgi:hypothetical protein